MLNFGLLVGDLVPKDEPAWKIYTNLRKVMALATCTALQKGCSKIMSNLISEHHTLVRNILGRVLKHKDHLNVHLHTVMEEAGPLVNIWAMRDEGKHQESKNIASSTTSNQNLCETIAKKHQLKFACILYEGKMFVDFKCSKSNLITFKKISRKTEIAICQKIFLKIQVTLYEWIEKLEIKYVSGMALCIDEYKKEPIFGIIKCICK